MHQNLLTKVSNFFLQLVLGPPPTPLTVLDSFTGELPTSSVDWDPPKEMPWAGLSAQLRNSLMSVIYHRSNEVETFDVVFNDGKRGFILTMAGDKLIELEHVGSAPIAAPTVTREEHEALSAFAAAVRNRIARAQDSE